MRQRESTKLKTQSSGVLLMVTGSVFVFIAAVGSIVAWENWYPVLSPPSIQSISQAVTSGTGIFLSRGFGTLQGIIGLVAAIGLLLTIPFVSVRRTRAVGVSLFVAMSVVTLVDGIIAAIDATNAWNFWQNLPYNSPLNTLLTSGFPQAIAHDSAMPAIAVTVAGIVALIGSVLTLRGTLKNRRSVSRDSREPVGG